nr:phosphatidate cytidylyltransferase [Fusobacterium russii]
MLLNKLKFSIEKYININQRINTWFIIIFIVFIGSLSRINIIILFAIISYLACIEFFSLTEVKRNIQTNFFIFLNIFIFYCSIYFKTSFLFFFSIFYSIVFTINFRKARVFICLIINIYMLGAITSIANINLILSLITLIELNDIFQYINGNLFGKIKISPKISPNKTLEGLIGGIVFTTITSIIFKIFFENNIIVSIIPILAILGFLGDIFISYFKRKYNKKDSGTLLKGHGGILDRIDSLIFNSVFLATIYNLPLLS